MNKILRGFTLIELLVVIGLIGLLSAIVLGALNNARAKGGDASIKENLNNIRSRAEFDYDLYGFYDSDTTATNIAAGNCDPTRVAGSLFADPNIAAMIAAAATASGVPLTDGTRIGCVTGGTTATYYAVTVALKTSSTNTWCVDSRGIAVVSPIVGADRGLINSGGTVHCKP